MRTLMENIEEDIEKIKRIIEEVKPQYVSFGGDIEFVDVKDHDVRIRPTGYCWR
jgi:Fe-S cluster biogenesis protein NfuA